MQDRQCLIWHKVTEDCDLLDGIYAHLQIPESKLMVLR